MFESWKNKVGCQGVVSWVRYTFSGESDNPLMNVPYLLVILAVVYFNKEMGALQAIRWLKCTTIGHC